MRSRLAVALVIAAAVLYACGPRSHTAETPNRKHGTAGPLVASSLDVAVGDNVEFVLHITNNAQKKLELTFPSGQNYDVTVLDSVGREVWRWSSGRMFTQALQNHVLEANETLTYEAAWNPESMRGAFVAVASLRSENHPLERRVPFSLP
ncbi:MAG: hypothetical protein MNPFHGCM_00807 [Gemmatimonadaceae bacterium]|nr:hypothetical protein [Gemmatimonadaceae bacterium]